MTITVVNRSDLADADLHRAIKAINRQFAEHFEPEWKFGAELRLHADAPSAHHGGRVSLADLPGLHGDAVIYLGDRATLAGAEGYHARNNANVPFGFVFVDVCREQRDEWSVALSHEAIELVGDPLANLLVQGPSPHDDRELVFYTFELCDPVTNDSYGIDDVQVADFVFPGWFSHGRTVADGASVAGVVHTDFKRRLERGDVLRPFATAPGGYLAYYDGRRDGDKWTTWTAPDDAVAAQRLAAKKQLAQTRVERRRRHAG